MERRKSKIIGNIGGNNVPVTIANALEKNVDIIGIIGEQYPDYWYIGNNDPNKYPNTAARIVDADVLCPSAERISAIYNKIRRAYPFNKSRKQNSY